MSSRTSNNLSLTYIEPRYQLPVSYLPHQLSQSHVPLLYLDMPSPPADTRELSGSHKKHGIFRTYIPSNAFGDGNCAPTVPGSSFCLHSTLSRTWEVVPPEEPSVCTSRQKHHISSTVGMWCYQALSIKHADQYVPLSRMAFPLPAMPTHSDKLTSQISIPHAGERRSRGVSASGDWLLSSRDICMHTAVLNPMLVGVK